MGWDTTAIVCGAVLVGADSGADSLNDYKGVITPEITRFFQGKKEKKGFYFDC